MSDRTKGLLITLLGVLAITPDGLLLRLVSADEWTTLFWRGVLTTVAITVVLAVIYKRHLPGHFLAIGVNGLWLSVLFAAGAVCFVMAVSLTKVANVLFIVSSAPLWAAIIAKVFLGESVPARTWMAIVVTMMGITVIASGSIEHGTDSVLGDGMALLAALSMAGTFSLARRSRARSMVPAMAVAGLIYAGAALPWAPTLVVDIADIQWLALMGLVSVPLGFSLLTLGPRYLPAPEVSLLLVLEAVLGPWLVWFVLDEHPGLRALCGGAIVLVTLLILNVSSLRENKQAFSQG